MPGPGKVQVHKSRNKVRKPGMIPKGDSRCRLLGGRLRGLAPSFISHIPFPQVPCESIAFWLSVLTLPWASVVDQREQNEFLTFCPRKPCDSVFQKSSRSKAIEKPLLGGSYPLSGQHRPCPHAGPPCECTLLLSAGLACLCLGEGCLLHCKATKDLPSEHTFQAFQLNLHPSSTSSFFFTSQLCLLCEFITIQTKNTEVQYINKYS